MSCPCWRAEAKRKGRDPETETRSCPECYAAECDPSPPKKKPQPKE